MLVWSAPQARQSPLGGFGGRGGVGDYCPHRALGTYKKSLGYDLEPEARLIQEILVFLFCICIFANGVNFGS